MISKKICLIGSFAVGKTSLVRRFVTDGFDEKYQTTIGVKIDKKEVALADQTLQFVIWDLEGPDEFAELRTTYLRGASGYFLVIDATRPKTLEIALSLNQKVRETLNSVPFLLLINKTDLEAERRISREELQPCIEAGWSVMETSAKTGRNVEHAFEVLAQMLVEHAEARSL
ncbi:MAG: GTP-binding protein [Ketobacter sp.]|nr:MAG: GTP-binding protein [Ketobacter sp.]